MLKSFKRKRILKKSNFGRSQGWEVELNSKKIAEFLTPQFVDMFWFEYELIIIDLSLSEEMKSSLFWEDQNLLYFSKNLNEYAKKEPLINIEPIGVKYKVKVRNLYIDS